MIQPTLTDATLHPRVNRRADSSRAAFLLSIPLAMALGVGSSSDAASDIRLTDVTKQSGIDFVMQSGRMPSREILEVNGGGVAFLDFDRDGDLDLFFANGATLADPEQGPGCRMYANRGDGTFEDVTRKLGIDVHRWAMGLAVGDVDGDGWDDIYITCFGPDILLRNECARAQGPRFVDGTESSGLHDADWGASAAFADLDGDGDLDLYVTNYLEFDVRHPPDRAGKSFKGMPVMAGPSGLKPQNDILYENIGGGRFRDVTRAAGIVERTPGYGLGVRIFDFDQDNKPDIFVGNDSTENFLFHNLGRMKFEDIAVQAGVAANFEGATQATMGIAVADVDGNGFPDLFSTNFSSDTDTLHINLGDGFFDDRTAQFGLGVITRPFLSWGCGFQDFDLDGDEDLFIASGHVYPEADQHTMDSEWAQHLLMFERSEKRFDRASDCGGMFKEKFHGRSVAFGDIDNDADVDIVMTTLNGPVSVFRNDAASPRRLAVELIGPPGNPHAYGSRLELTASNRIQRRWITGSGSYQSVDAPYAYFGWREAPAGAEPPVIKVIFSDGREAQQKIAPDQRRLRIQCPDPGGASTQPSR